MEGSNIPVSTGIDYDNQTPWSVSVCFVILPETVHVTVYAATWTVPDRMIIERLG